MRGHIPAPSSIQVSSFGISPARAEGPRNRLVNLRLTPRNQPASLRLPKVRHVPHWTGGLTMAAAPTPIRKEALYAEAPATAAVSDKVHNLIQMMSEKLDSVWRYDKYIEDCRDDTECRRLFRRM